MFATKLQIAEFIKAVCTEADQETLDALEKAIRERRAAMREARNATLPEFPVLRDPNGTLVSVTRDKAIELLDGGRFTLAEPTEGKR